MGTYEDVRNIYGSYADIAFYLSAGPLTVSRRVQDALDDNIFTYYTKQQIINQLNGMKRREDAPSDGYLMPEKDFKAKITAFNTTLDAYIQASVRACMMNLFMLKSIQNASERPI